VVVLATAMIGRRKHERLASVIRMTWDLLRHLLIRGWFELVRGWFEILPARSLPAAEAFGEADVRRVDVEHPELGAPGVAEAVPDPGGCGHERARLRAEGVATDEELGLAREDVERVDEVRVHVRVDALEVGAEPELDGFELRKLAQDAVMALGALDVLAALGPKRHDAVHAASMAAAAS
jgi:hypothetical protein